MVEDFGLKTDVITAAIGSSVLCWDTMFIKNRDPAELPRTNRDGYRGC